MTARKIIDALKQETDEEKRPIIPGESIVCKKSFSDGLGVVTMIVDRVCGGRVFMTSACLRWKMDLLEDLYRDARSESDSFRNESVGNITAVQMQPDEPIGVVAK